MTVMSEGIRSGPRRPTARSLSPARAFWLGLRDEFATDRPLYVAVAIYIVLAFCLALALPGHQPVHPFLYTSVWLRGGVAVFLLFILFRTLPDILRNLPDRPLKLLLVRVSGFVTPRALAGLALIALQVLLKGTFTSVKNMLPDISGYVWDERLADIDAALSGGIDPWWLLTPVASRIGILDGIEFLYATGWMLALGLVPAIVALSPSFGAIRVRFFLTYLLCWVLLGNLLAVIQMSAGPVYFGDVTGDFERFRPLVGLLSAGSGTVWSAHDIQRALWAVYERDMVSLGTGISAFPSLHVSMATLWAIVGFRKNRWFGAAGLAFLAFVMIASVTLGWHYAIDGYASILLTLLIWAGVGWFHDRVARRPIETPG